MKVFIKEVTEKTSGKGNKYLLVKHETGSCGCWHNELFDILKAHQGKELEMEIVQKGDFFNIESCGGITPQKKTGGGGGKRQLSEEDWDKINDKKQESIKKGMAFNGAVSLAGHLAPTMPKKELLENVNELYIGLYGILKNTELK